ncbi:hypothetical protein SmJEL517_g03436 [Synchytrium microbalum]|uniref:Uncharacterized protein n=1 Tax=Synchytrium microbalum TaxID=1806994 RepID=A0A507C326_9FUNG|nr:uncharacterized protein SmJEL517_g03436 [Synchytrium microbalum]TPX33768.1 hypothetical protein SmJEL517_g03436 [Synchytrium microbalum]
MKRKKTDTAPSDNKVDDNDGLLLANGETRIKKPKPNSNYIPPGHVRRRPPQRAATLETDIYVSKKTYFVAALKRARKVLDNPKIGFINIHGLGAMIAKAASIALRIDEETPGVYERDVTISSVSCFDDIEPDDEDEEPETKKRFTSAIHIRMTKKKGLPLV